MPRRRMRIHHLALRTRALARLERFYVDGLGLAVQRRRPGAVWLRAGDAVVMLEEAGPNEPHVPDGTMELLAFRVEPAELSTLLDRLSAAGVQAEARTEHTHYFRDPDGRRVGVSTHPLA